MAEKTVKFFFEPKVISKVKQRQSQVICTYTRVSAWLRYPVST